MSEKKKKENPQAEKANEEIKEEAKTEETGEQTEKAEEKTEEKATAAAESNEKLLRLMAEYDNYRKRTQKEKVAAYADTKCEVISKFLPVIDNFERASKSEGDLESYKKGIEMTVSQLLGVLTTLGVEAFGEAGEEFDPVLHNGVLHIEDEALGQGVIAEVFEKGYRLGDRVIRCAAVKVAN